MSLKFSRPAFLRCLKAFLSSFSRHNSAELVVPPSIPQATISEVSINQLYQRGDVEMVYSRCIFNLIDPSGARCARSFSISSADKGIVNPPLAKTSATAFASTSFSLRILRKLIATQPRKH